jgi:hypothetical protein
MLMKNVFDLQKRVKAFFLFIAGMRRPKIICIEKFKIFKECSSKFNPSQKSKYLESA